MSSPIVQGPLSTATIGTGNPKSITCSATPAGNTLLCLLYAQNATALTGSAVTDSASNTWTKIATLTTGRYMELWRCRGAASITSVAPSQTNGNAYGATFLDIGPTTADDDIEVLGSATAGTTAGPCNATATAAADVGVSFVHWNGNITSEISTSSPWTAAPTGSDVDGNTAWINPPTSGSATGPTWTESGGTSAGWGTITAFFKTAQSAFIATGLILN